MQTNNVLRKIQRLVDLREYVDVDAAAIAIRENVAFRGPNITILFCAIIIASVGLNVNSIPVIIGAMLISPLMSPIIGFGLAMGTDDVDLFWKSLKNLGIMVGISILSAALYFLVSPLDMETPTELLARTNPTIYDVLIALFGGLAGILETSRKEKGTVMSGVAIATALMPPLCTVGYGLATFQSKFFFGALYLFFINFTFIALAAYIGTKYLGYKMVKAEVQQRQVYRKLFFSLVLIGMIVPSVISAVQVVRENNFTRTANAFVRENKHFARSYIYDYKVHNDQSPAALELFVAGEEPDSIAYTQLYASARAYGLASEQVHLHLDAAYAAQKQIDENELVRDIFRSNENQLLRKNQEIAALQQQVDSLNSCLQAAQLPYEAIKQEIRAQFPQIDSVILAADEHRGMIAVILMPYKQTLRTQDIAHLQDWLCVRLHTQNAFVIQQNRGKK